MTIDDMRKTLEEQRGILNLIPVFVPRRFGNSGHSLRLHPDDYYAYGTARGSIKERWFSSIITPMNGNNMVSEEGLSFVNIDGDTDHKVSLKDFVETLGAELIGDYLYDTYGTWPMYSKFFDYEAFKSLPHPARNRLVYSAGGASCAGVVSDL